MFVVITWFVVITEFLLPINKYDVYFPVLEGILDFLTFPFSICVPPITFFRFLFLLKAVIGCSWNNSHKFLLVWKMFQFLQTTSVKFSKNRWSVNMECFFVVFDLFLVVGNLLQGYQLFLIAHQQVYDRKLASKIIFLVLLSVGENLSWLSRFFLYVVFGYR